MARECLYATLGVAQDADDAALRKAYRAAALAHHPDKNRGADEAAAAERFKAIQHAYEVLSDPHERAWYDSHRESILRGAPREHGDDSQASAGEATSLDLFSYFTSAAYGGFDNAPDSFFAVFADVFGTLAAEERAAGAQHPTPPFGGPDSAWDVPRDFYRVWESFASKKTFAFADKWNLSEAPNRDYRRAMERENKRERAKLKKEFNALVRELVAFVKKRDPRVKARKEHEHKLKEQREQELREREARETAERKIRAAEARAQRDAALEEHAEELDKILEQLALDEELDRRDSRNKRSRRRRRAYDVSSEEDEDEEPVGNTDEDDANGEVSADDSADAQDPGTGEPHDAAELGDASDQRDLEEEDLYCQACHKSFRSAGQKANHEQSRKHIAATAKLRERLVQEDSKFASANCPEASLGNGMQNGSVDEENFDESAATSSSKSKRDKKEARKRSLASSALRGDDSFESEPPDDSAPFGDSHESAPQQRDEQAPDDAKAERRLKRKQKRKEKASGTGGGKEDDDVAKDRKIQHRCNVCDSVFPTRNKLFAHVKEKGHALRK